MSSMPRCSKKVKSIPEIEVLNAEFGVFDFNSTVFLGDLFRIILASWGLWLCL